MNRAVVLIVDDDAENRSSILEVLTKRFDCDFRQAQDGEEAVEFVRTNPCDVMLLDVKMPKKDGIEVIKEVRAINPMMDILVVSAYSGDEIADDFLKRSSIDHVIKPLDVDSLILKFENMLIERGQRIARPWGFGL